MRNPAMRRALLGWMLGWAAEWTWLVVLFVYAFGVGGLGVVGAVGLARTLPAAILAPALSSLADALPRHRLLLGIHAARAALLGAAALVVTFDGPPLVVFGVAAIDALMAVLFRPTHMSMLPSLARSPDDLVGANVASSTVEAVGILVGPIVGAGLVATGSVPATFAAPALLFVLGALSVAGLRPSGSAAGVDPRSGERRSVLRGLRALRERPYAASLLALFGVQTIVRGILSVLIVAGAIEMLGMGEEGVGLLNAAIGAGGLVGALSAVAVVGRRRMARPILLGLVLWGVPILVTGVAPAAVVAIAAMAVVGAGNAVLDIAGFTLLQRIVPNRSRGSVFGVLEALVMLTVGVGAALGPLLVSVAGLPGAWMITGAVLPMLALLSWRVVTAADEHAVIPERELHALRGVPMLQVLPLTVLEQVAADLRPVSFPAGATIISQGAVGDRFYVIVSGEVDVRVGERIVRRQLSGESFGEVALLHDVPRTAGVVAATDVELLAIGREAFVAAVTGDYQSRQAAEEVISSRLAAD
jgi:predicted MFS family arabinose efflux permease